MIAGVHSSTSCSKPSLRDPGSYDKIELYASFKNYKTKKNDLSAKLHWNWVLKETSKGILWVHLNAPSRYHQKWNERKKSLKPWTNFIRVKLQVCKYLIELQVIKWNNWSHWTRCTQSNIVFLPWTELAAQQIWLIKSQVSRGSKKLAMISFNDLV